MLRFAALTLAAVVVLLALGALLTWRQARLAESRHPPIGRFLTTPLGRLHFVDRGTGPALVLLHGAGANLLDFEHSLAPHLGAFRLVLVDRPGSGYSELPPSGWPDPQDQARAVLALLAEQGVEEGLWIGHSWGGAVVLAGLLEAPERVRGGVLLAGAAYPWAGGADLLDRLPAWPLVGPLVTHTLISPAGHLLLDAGVRRVFAPNEPTPDYGATGPTLYLRPGAFTATARDLRRLSAFLAAQAPRYGALAQPLLLVHGEADTIVPAWNHTDRLVRLLPRSEVLRLPDTGHAPHHVHPGRIARRIATFAERVLGTEAAP